MKKKTKRVKTAPAILTSEKLNKTRGLMEKWALEGALGPPTECPKCAQWKNVGKRFCPAHWVNIVNKEGDRLSRMVKASPKELRDYIHELETRCQ